MSSVHEAPPLPPSTLRYTQTPHIAHRYDTTFAHTELFEYDCRLLTQWFSRPGKLVDFGCGTGRHLTLFAGLGFDVTGVDLSPHMLETCRSKLAAAGLSARLILRDFTGLDSGDVGLFDYGVCMFSTLGMIKGYDHRVRYLTSMLRCVRPGGAFAMHAHNALHDAWRPSGPFWMLGAWLWVKARGLDFGDRIMRDYRAIPAMYVHLFTENELRRALSEAGWETVEFVHLNARRNGRLRGRFARGLRANGFIILARRPE